MDLDKLKENVADLKRKLAEKMKIAERMESEAIKARRYAEDANDALNEAIVTLYEATSIGEAIVTLYEATAAAKEAKQ